jgi:hypothetical protein
MIRPNIILIAVFITSLIGSTAPTAEAAKNTSNPETNYFVRTEAEKRVREYFKDTPVMIEIARCESNFRQYTDAGTVLRGGDSGGMVGTFQFFESIHATPAKALGFDITTLEGNLAYAKHVYTNEGTTPWNPAKHCWGTTASSTASTADREKLLEQIATLHKHIAKLQKKLASKQKRRL